MMKHALTGLVAAGLAFACAPAAHAEDFFAPDMNIQLGPGGTISATFGNSGIPQGLFTDTFSFTIGDDGTGSGSIVTNADLFQGINDTDLLSVFVNGLPLQGLIVGQFESGFIQGVPIIAGVLNQVVINGFSRGNGSYGATATFTPNAIPEPATWAFMLLGFAAIGLAARHRSRTVRISFS